VSASTVRDHTVRESTGRESTLRQVGSREIGRLPPPVERSVGHCIVRARAAKGAGRRRNSDSLHPACRRLRRSSRFSGRELLQSVSDCGHACHRLVSACVTLVAERAGGQLSCVRAGTSHLTRGHGAGSTEHEWSRIVYGMPRAAIERGAVDRIVPLSRMAEATVLAPSAAAPAGPA